MLKNSVYNNSILGNIDFLSYGACVITKMDLEARFSRMREMGNFSYVSYTP